MLEKEVQGLFEKAEFEKLESTLMKAVQSEIRKGSDKKEVVNDLINSLVVSIEVTNDITRILMGDEPENNIMENHAEITRMFEANLKEGYSIDEEIKKLVNAQAEADYITGILLEISKQDKYTADQRGEIALVLFNLILAM